MIGAALKEHESNPGAEYNFCYKPVSTATNFAQTRGASLLRAGSANNAVVEDGGVAGFCDLTTTMEVIVKQWSPSCCKCSNRRC